MATAPVTGLSQLSHNRGTWAPSALQPLHGIICHSPWLWSGMGTGGPIASHSQSLLQDNTANIAPQTFLSHASPTQLPPQESNTGSSISQLTPQYEMPFFVATLKLKSPQKYWSWPQGSHENPTTKEATLHRAEHQYPFTRGQAIPTALPLTITEHQGEARECSTNGAVGCNLSGFHLLSSMPRTVVVLLSRKSWL